MHHAPRHSLGVIALLALPAVAGSAGCGDSATNPLEVPVIITLTAAIDTFHSIGQRVQLEVVATDSVGNPQRPPS